ncbi:MAG: chorismate synthase [Chloroflexi bacterium]|nr:chorismate synthase [Chloroflexota bacterium]
MTTFRFLTAGESHGQALSVIVEGVPAGLPLTEDYLARDLARRQGGYGRGGRMAIEQDRAQLLAGVRYGQTLGSPIAMLIQNRDWANWREVMAVASVETPVPPVTRLRPGHADLAGALKYNLGDVRPILERASARETAARVAAGAIARRLLEELGVAIHSHTLAIGAIAAKVPRRLDWGRVEASPVRCADPQAERAMMAAIDAAREAGDSLGGLFEVIATGVPPGLGSHVHWERRLDGRLAQALMSINAVKGVEIGDAFASARQRGSQVHDIFRPTKADPWARASNRAGGLEGGISNGQPVVVRAALKPIPTLAHPLPSADLATGEVTQAHQERSDVCVVPAAGVVGEAMVALTLAAAALEKFGGDHLEEVCRNLKAYLATTGPRKGKR